MLYKLYKHHQKSYLKIDVLRQNKIVHLEVMPQGKRDQMGKVTGVL